MCARCVGKQQQRRVGHTSVHCESGSRAWGSGVCARRVEQQQQQQKRADRYYRFTLEGEAAPPPLEPPPTNGLCNSPGCVSATPPSIAIAAPVLGGPEVVRVVLNSSSIEVEGAQRGAREILLRMRTQLRATGAGG